MGERPSGLLMGTFEIIEPYLIYALTPVHAGCGRGYGGYVDLQVQRDWLGIPVIWSSSIKGALRSAFRRAKSTGDQASDEERVIFGPERERASEHAGSLAVLDAKLLLVPVRSVRGAFAYVTTPTMLGYALRIAEVKGDQKLSSALREIIETCERAGGRGVAVSDVLLVGDGKVCLRERLFEVEVKSELKGKFEVVLGRVLDEACLKRIVVLPDDPGVDFVSRATMVVTRVALDYSKKTVRAGALWDEEYIPETSIFVTAFLSSRPRGSHPSIRTARDVIRELLETLGADGDGSFYLALGGHETVGKGIVKFVKWQPK